MLNFCVIVLHFFIKIIIINTSMYSRFILKDFKKLFDEFINENKKFYYQKGSEDYSMQKNEIEKSLGKLLDDTYDSVESESIKKIFFPKRKFHIFISHSHKDIDDIIAFAGWLKEKFNATCFIDSLYWGSFKDLESQLLDKYDEYTFEAKIENISRAATDSRIILESAITEMIHSTECFLFLCTENSFDDYKTSSSWLYYENMQAKSLRTIDKQQHRFDFAKTCENFGLNFLVTYKYDFSEFITLNIHDFDDALKFFKNKECDGHQLLDFLYSRKLFS